jgi:hypothetical protein
VEELTALRGALAGLPRAAAPAGLEERVLAQLPAGERAAWPGRLRRWILTPDGRMISTRALATLVSVAAVLVLTVSFWRLGAPETAMLDMPRAERLAQRQSAQVAGEAVKGKDQALLTGEATGVGKPKLEKKSVEDSEIVSSPMKSLAARGAGAPAERSKAREALSPPGEGQALDQLADDAALAAPSARLKPRAKSADRDEVSGLLGETAQVAEKEESLAMGKPLTGSLAPSAESKVAGLQSREAGVTMRARRIVEPVADAPAEPGLREDGLVAYRPSLQSMEALSGETRPPTASDDLASDDLGAVETPLPAIEYIGQEIELLLTVSADGRVSKAAVLGPDSAAVPSGLVESVKQWRFRSPPRARLLRLHLSARPDRRWDLSLAPIPEVVATPAR